MHILLLTHLRPLVYQLCHLIFDDLFPFYSAVFMFELANNLLPFIIYSMFVRLGGKTRRNVCDYFLPRVQLNVYKKFISFSGVQTCTVTIAYSELKCITKSMLFIYSWYN